MKGRSYTVSRGFGVTRGSVVLAEGSIATVPAEPSTAHDIGRLNPPPRPKNKVKLTCEARPDGRLIDSEIHGGLATSFGHKR